MEDLTEAVKKTLVDRINTPLFGFIVISWIMYNWSNILFVILSKLTIEQRLNALKAEGWLLLLYGLALPALTGFALSVVFPYLQLGVNKLQKGAQNRNDILSVYRERKECKAAISLSKIRAKAESSVYYEKALNENKISKLERMTEENRSRVNELRTENESAEKELSNRKKELEKVSREIMGSKAKLEVLNRKLKDIQLDIDSRLMSSGVDLDANSIIQNESQSIKSAIDALINTLGWGLSPEARFQNSLINDSEKITIPGPIRKKSDVGALQSCLQKVYESNNKILDTSKEFLF
ncbi:TPA: hypothetical protein SMI30_003926 [Serratia marcescens]|uniref:hypothetical protein n=1 Tax=Serratia marcescens TaxID=615 RepID=UPI0029ED152D|nr:hypothetical protein [Serratia marcescens]HEJ7975202.1 hypothetical protein [Serratia marcescens]